MEPAIRAQEAIKAMSDRQLLEVIALMLTSMGDESCIETKVAMLERVAYKEEE